MTSLLFCLLLFFLSTCNIYAMKISGKLIFSGSNGKSIPSPAIPDGSLLTVKFEDTSLMDAPSVTLGSSTSVINGHKPGNELTFSISAEDKVHPHRGIDYSLSAVLNMGWQASGDEWVRQGDWLNTSHCSVKIEPGKDEYVQDCTVELYS